tara:strand:+ start:287 stop:514 length:228 start_codon:yes stop_codon:yes gene_type:complete
MINSKKAQTSILFLLLFGAALIFYAVMFPELSNIVEQQKNTTSDETIILIYDFLPIGIGFMLMLAVILSVASIVR